GKSRQIASFVENVSQFIAQRALWRGFLARAAPGLREYVVQFIRSRSSVNRIRYTHIMIAAEERPLDGFLEPLGKCLTPEVARKIVALRANRKTQARVDLLADKCTEGTLTKEERKEYEA